MGENMNEDLLKEVAELNGLTVEKCECGQGGFYNGDHKLSHEEVMDAVFGDFYESYCNQCINSGIIPKPFDSWLNSTKQD
jgi:hypothetical protein